MIVYIQTESLGNGKYELFRTETVGFYCKDEQHEIIDAPDRMVAAMINLGRACRWLTDKDVMRGEVVIVTDTDGLDKRYAGEHNDLYNAIHTRSGYRDSRAKYRSFYGDYIKYLDKIRSLADQWEIVFTLQPIEPFWESRYQDTTLSQST